MKRKRFFRCVAAVLLCFAVTAPCLLCGVGAAEPGNCSLQLSYQPGKLPMAHVTFRAYRVADVDLAAVTYTPTAVYAPYHVLTAPDNWLSRAATLAGYVARDSLPADREGVTNDDGSLLFDNLPPGLYLITGAAASRDGRRYTPTPFLISLPHTEDGYIWSYSLTTQVKYTYRSPGGGSLQHRVIKVWQDEGSEDLRPSEVTVDLLRDGSVYATAALSPENNWRHSWTGLPDGFDYQVVERSPGEEYAVSVSQTGAVSVITNTYGEDIIEDEDPPLIDTPDIDPPEIDGGTTDITDEDTPLSGGLPQTGLLWWPVPLLALAGCVLLSLGVLRRRRDAYEEK